MPQVDDPLPDDIDALKAAYLSERAARQAAEAMIAHLKLTIAKLNHAKYGPSAERSRKLLDQMELQLEELEAGVTEDECAAEAIVAKAEQNGSVVASFTRKKPARAPLPAHLPRERVVIPAPSSCPCCQGKLVKLGEDITETLEVIPRQWKVILT